ncbi:hypothetical protein ES708_16992 [subsurface metagenome]
MNYENDIKARMPRPKIGLLPTGHLYYWDQFPGLKDMCMNMHDKMVERLGQIGDVFSPGLVDTSEKALGAGGFFRNENVDILLVLPLGYTTGMVVLPCVKQMDVPVRILNTHLDMSYDYKSADTTIYLYHEGSCCIPEYAAGLISIGKKFKVRTGPFNSDRFWDEVSADCHGAASACAFRSMNIGIIGNTYTGMVDMPTDEHRWLKATILFLSLILFSMTSYIYSQDRTPIKPVKVSEPPVIDGVLDEDLWKETAGISEFKTWIPDYGKDLPYKTIVWEAYDEENLYFAFRCFDSEPDKIKVSVNARDKIRQDDWVCVNIDSFNDHQTWYCIYVNANGIQQDSRYTAGKEDMGVDLVFYSAGKIDEQGYSVEIKVPLKSIRFLNREPVIMAVFFERYISRLSIIGTYPPLNPDKGWEIASQMQLLQYEGVKRYTFLEILPALTYSYNGVQDGGKMTTTENKPDAGLTAKYGITSQLILDATLNPDFSQVEADAGQVDVNLRYQLFFPEKRPFFQEGNENFQISGLSFDSPIYSLVHTRNIANPIAGAKLSGKIGIKNILSVMYAADRIPEENKILYGKIAHYPVLRYKRSFKNDSYLGAIGTAVEKENSSNMVYGADGQIRVNQSTLFEFHGLFSYTVDTASGVDKKPGHAFSIFLHSEQRDLDYNIGTSNLNEFFISQTGYITRRGVTSFSGGITPKLYTNSKIFRRFNFGLYTKQTKDNIYDKWETYNYLYLTALLGGTLNAKIKYNYSSEIYLNGKFNTSGFQVVLTGRVGTKIDGSLSYNNRQFPYYSTLSQGYGNSYLADIRYLPFEKLHTQITFTYQNLFLESDNSKVFEYLIARGRITYQINKYLFLRGILEYNDFRKSLITDFLASFTYIPGTVFHIGYGSLYEQKEWDGSDYIQSDKLMEMKRGFLLKISYLFRL